MAYIGLVPSEHASSDKRHLGPIITKMGNSRARRLLVEGAHSYRFQPKSLLIWRNVNKACLKRLKTLLGKLNCGFLAATDKRDHTNASNMELPL